MTASQHKLHGTLVSPTNNNLSLVITNQAGVAKMSNGTGHAPTQQSNGGIKRAKHTVQSKLGVWMTDNTCTDGLLVARSFYCAATHSSTGQFVMCYTVLFLGNNHIV
jgi:hypothetical protein